MKIAVAMSGGVDSSVAACLLHEQGHHLVGFFMRTGATVASTAAPRDRHRGCCSAADAADARFVAFESDASNLVQGDTNAARDIFVHDRQTGETTRVSVDSDGNEATYGADWPAISGDGRHVAFASVSPDLVQGDTNAAEDIFVHDRQTGETTRVSVGHGLDSANSIQAAKTATCR